jgi:hypothetical protein
LDNTGRRPLPRIIVKPEFFASEKIEATFKEFYRKSANSFLRTEILRKKDYEASIANELSFMAASTTIAALEKTCATAKEEDVRGLNKRRISILKQGKTCLIPRTHPSCA